MELYYSIVIFVFGMIFGSFYNVVGFRLPKELSLAHPGSYCPKCNHELKWYELIPVFSFLVQGGKCRVCKDKISFFYPMIEFSTGILFLLCYLLFGFSIEFVMGILVSSFFMIVIVSDVNYLIIPDEVTIFFSLAILLVKLISGGFDTFISAVISGACLFLIMYLIMFIGNRVFKRESMGGGDIKLMFFVGTLLAIPEGLFVIFGASLIALPVSILVLYFKKSHIIPYGPFILMATLIIYFLQLDVLKLLEIA